MISDRANPFPPAVSPNQVTLLSACLSAVDLLIPLSHEQDSFCLTALIFTHSVLFTADANVLCVLLTSAGSE